MQIQGLSQAHQLNRSRAPKTRQTFGSKSTEKVHIHHKTWSNLSITDRLRKGFNYAIQNWPSALAAMTIMVLATLVMPVALPLIPIAGLMVAGVKFITGFFSKELSLPESPAK